MKASERWLRQIYATLAEEISCSQCLDLISAYVDLEVNGEDARHRLPLVKQHMDQCPVCCEEYELLLDLVQQENKGDSPAIDDLNDLPA